MKGIGGCGGWGYVERGKWSVRVWEGVVNGVKGGKSGVVEVMKEGGGGKEGVEMMGEKGEKRVMVKDGIRGGMYGCMEVNGEGGDVVKCGRVKIGRKGMVFGESVKGMWMSWCGVNLGKSGKYDGGVLRRNVRY